MALPKGIDISVLGSKNSFEDYLERSMVMNVIREGLEKAGFEDVGIVYNRNDSRTEPTTIMTVFDVAAKYFPELRKVPITIAVQKPNRFYHHIDLEAENLIIGRMHNDAEKNAKKHLRSHAKPFPL